MRNRFDDKGRDAPRMAGVLYDAVVLDEKRDILRCSFPYVIVEKKVHLEWGKQSYSVERKHLRGAQINLHFPCTRVGGGVLTWDAASYLER